MKKLVILHDRAYGDERANNGLRLAGILAKRDGVEVKAFGSGDAVGCAVAGQQVLNGYYHLDRMIPSAARHGRGIGLCGSCMDARGIDDRSRAEPECVPVHVPKHFRQETSSEPP